MTSPFIVVIAVGVLGFILQWFVLRAAGSEIRIRTQAWLDRAGSGDFRRQTREHAVAELERMLSLTPAAVGLRKLGIMAPLLGVVLTAGSVIFGGASVATVASGSNVADVPRIIQGLAPLLAGVTVGALLAIVNQLMLIAFHRTEDRLIREATAILENGWFRDTDDRVELVVEQVAGLGTALQDLIQRVQQVVLGAAAAGEQLKQSVVAASEGLEKASSDLKVAIEEPSRQFAAAAEQLVRTAKAGLTHHGKVTAAFEKMQETGFDRIEEVQRQQLKAVREGAEVVEQLRGLLASAAELRVSEWNASFTAAASSAENMKESMVGLVRTLGERSEEFHSGLSRSSDSIRAAIAKLEGSLSEFETRCRQAGEATNAWTFKAEEITRFRDGMRELVETMSATTRSIQTSAAGTASRGTGFSWFRSGS